MITLLPNEINFLCISLHAFSRRLQEVKLNQTTSKCKERERERLGTSTSNKKQFSST